MMNTDYKEKYISVMENYATHTNDELMKRFGVTASFIEQLRHKHNLKKSKDAISRCFRIRDKFTAEDINKGVKIRDKVISLIGRDYETNKMMENVICRVVTTKIMREYTDNRYLIAEVVKKDRSSTYHYEKLFDIYIQQDKKFKRLYDEAKKVCNI